MKTDVKRTARVRLSSCQYGLSRLPFRGPRRPTEGRFIACLGGSDTFARHVHEPFPDQLEQDLGEVCVNLGSQNAGPDLFLQDNAVRALVHDARAVVIQLPGAANLSNRFYRVHPRRNDRFIGPTDALRAAFPQVDFAEIAFTGHLMERLHGADPDMCHDVRKVLQATWLRRMKALIALARGPVHLLWFARRSPDDPAPIGADPAFVTRAMLDRLAPHVAGLTEVIEAEPDTVDFVDMAASGAMGIAAHARVARALSPGLRDSMA